MLLVGQINNKRAVQAFSDYLQLQNITHQVQAVSSSETADEQGYEVLVESPYFHQAQALFEDFVSNPNQAKFLDASWQVSQVDKSGTESIGLKRIWASGQPLTQIVFALCVLVYAASYLGWFRTSIENFGFALSWTEPYRLITPAFIHLSDMHIVFNLGWWWYLGSRVEKLLGKQTLVIVLLVSALVSNLAQGLLVSSHFAGLSGVNYGMAGFVWFCGYYYKSRSLFLPNNIFIFLVGWMLLGFADLIPYVSMANWAHLGGLLAGFGLALLLVKPSK
jgi:GlpG protein